MKFLLAIVMSTAFTATAMAACDVDSSKDCTTKESCEGLNAKGGKKFSFDEKASVKCMVDVAVAATDCAAGDNGKREGKAAAGASAVDAKDGKAVGR